MQRDIAEIILSRIGSDFDGECHLTEEEAREAAAEIARLREKANGQDVAATDWAGKCTERVIRDGETAVLYSPGYGAGWSTWANDEFIEFALFDSRIVNAVLDERHSEIPALVESILGPESYFYCGGADDLVVRWIPVGTQFRINEYDGSESIEFCSDVDWKTA